ncbi:MAG: hypothetical protein VX466_10785 [Myxococcota bacterium]|nr:hypothetical protein [Myxococcota bacterium]
MFRHTSVWVLALAIGASALAGCSFGEVYLRDPLLREVALTEQQKHYSALIRWSAFNKAARYVQNEHREAFMKAAPPLKRFRFTDYESDPISIDEDGECTVEVLYYGYRTDSPYEVEVRETQHWKRGGVGNAWQVSSVFEGLDAPRSRASVH